MASAARMSHQIRVATGLVFLAWLAGASTARAQCSTTSLSAFDAEAFDRLGRSVALSPSSGGGPMRMLAGAPSDTVAGGATPGSVRFFGENGGLWSEFTQMAIVPSDGANFDDFGYAVGLSDPYAVVGAPGSGGTGAVYFFERLGSSWIQRTRSVPAGMASGDRLGAAVALSGNMAVVGAPYHDAGGSPSAGVAYIYTRESQGNWTRTFDLVESAATRASGNNAGLSVGISGNIAVVGIPRADNGALPDVGAIDIYRVTGGQLIPDGHFWPPTLYANDLFGSAVAIDGGTIAVGAPLHDTTLQQTPDAGAHTDAGCVYVLHWNGAAWVVEDTVYAQNGSDDAHFGSAVAVEGGRMVVAAIGAHNAYVFRRALTPAGYRWVQDAVVVDPDSPSTGAVGWAAALSRGVVALGDPGDDSAAANAGAVYIYEPGSVYSDSCGGAPAVHEGTYYGCTDYATVSPGAATCGGASNGPDIWFRWTPGCSGQAVLDTLGSSFDTVLSVHTSCPGGGVSNTLVCNDDGPWGVGPSQVMFGYVTGQDYLIRIAGYNGVHGAFTLHIWAGAPPANDACASAMPIGNGAFPFATCAATTDGLSACAGQVIQDLWYRYTAPCTGAVAVDTCGADFDTQIVVYPGSGCPTHTGGLVACNDDAPAGAPCGSGTLQSYLTLQAMAGQSFLIRVGGYDRATGSGSGTLHVSCTQPCPVDFNHDGAVNVSDFLGFLQAYSAGAAAADFNGNGAVNVQDFLAFLSAYAAGC